MYALRASDVRLCRVAEETLRVSILNLMDKTEGFVPQLARKGKHHAHIVRSSLAALRQASRAFGAHHYCGLSVTDR
jgi:hypothetical protein